MGGGDLNTKKSWHPNTMKNQERVWKAEQAAAEEKKRILELQRERDMEHDRAKLNEMAQRNFGNSSSGGDSRLHWMYDKPNKQAQHEDYLLGKAIGKDDSETSQQNIIPAVSRRVVGSSMLTSTDDTQVDLTRKLREDPLLLVKERERAARAALLNNPLQRKKIADLLRKEKEQTENQTKKKSKKKGADIDKLLAAKLNALGGEKGINLANLLNSDSDASSSSDHSKSKKKKKSKKKRKKRKKSDSDSSDDNDDRHNRDKNKKKIKTKEKSAKSKNKSSPRNSDFDIPSRKKAESMKVKYDDSREDNRRIDRESRKRRSSDDERDMQPSKKSKRKSYYGSEVSSENEREKRHASRDKKHNSYGDNRRTGIQDKRSRAMSPRRPEKDLREKKKGMSEEERNARLAAMAAAGAEHEAERGRRVAQQRIDDAAAEAVPRTSRGLNNEARSLPQSLQSRIQSNRHYIQRDRTHMDKNFARR